jgi:hypothetical protein
MPETMINVHDARLVRQKGYEALTKTLGSVGTVYFIRQFSSGKGNWTEDRKEILAGLTMADVEKDVAFLREHNDIFDHSNIKSYK